MKTKLLITICMVIAVFTINAQTWTQQASSTNPRGQHGCVSHPNGNVYIFGGQNSALLSSLEIFNESANTWSTGAVLPLAIRGMSYALGPDTMIYSFSGVTGTTVTNCYKYGVVSNAWTAIANIPQAIWYSAAATVGNKIYIFGGENYGTLVQSYTPSTNTWATVATTIPVAVKEHAAVAFNGKVYIIGGNYSVPMNNVQIYDPVANTWTTGANMPNAAGQFAYALGSDNKIYCIGGKSSQTNNSSPFYNYVQIYDPIANTWSAGPIIPHGLGETAASCVNSGINVMSGADSATVYSTWNYRMTVTPLGIAQLSNNESFNVYPNPSSGNIHFSYSTGEEENMTVTVMDMSGRQIYAENWAHFNGEMEKTIEMGAFPAGLYMIRCISDKAGFTRKVIVE
jgi:N-acetylneuraminic acid mutarotase